MLSLISIFALALSTLAAPAMADYSAGESALPATVEFYVLEAGAQVGCVNGYGNFTTDVQYCFPFRAFAAADGFQQLWSYDYCTADGVLDCYGGATATDGAEFYEVTASSTLGTGTTTDFSVDSIPVDTDNIGVPIIVGTTGAIEVTLSTLSVSG